MDTRERNNVGFFGEILSDFSDSWYFTAGARHDDNDDFGSNTSYRISSVRLIDVANAGTLKFKASIGTGFRAPSPYEIAYNTGPWASAPASLVSLQQERSKGYEAGAEWLAINGLRLEAVYFDQRVDDAIIFDLNGYSGYLQDAGRSTSRGIELSTEVQLSATLSLQANYTWNDTNRPDGTQRLRRPENLANAGLRWQLQPKLALNAFVRASHNAVDQDFSGVVVLDDFSVLDLNASYSVSDSLQLYGRLENALAERYEEVTGYNTSGTAAFVGFRMNLGVR
jgi:vitamin B12 transporter